MDDVNAHQETVTDPIVTAGISDETISKLEGEDCIRPYLVEKYQKEAKRNWDLFYKRNTTNFFKDRHWLAREFPELVPSNSNDDDNNDDGKTTDNPDNNSDKDGSDATTLSNQLETAIKLECSSKLTILEVGCGVGNTVFPLLDAYQGLFVHCCDFSPRAVAFVQAHEQYDSSSCNAFECDLTKQPLAENVPKDSVDCVTMLFVMSAISPQYFADVVKNVLTVVKPGGCVLFRDYGLYDHAMLRFKPGHKLSDAFYVRSDGTQAYYYTTTELQKLFEDGGFTTKQCQYVAKRTTNRKMKVDVPRIFVQGKFVKPNN